MIGDENSGTIETPALIFVSNVGSSLNIYYVDSDSFSPQSMGQRDRTLLEAFITVACQKLGWEATEENGA